MKGERTFKFFILSLLDNKVKAEIVLKRQHPLQDNPTPSEFQSSTS